MKWVQNSATNTPSPRATNDIRFFLTRTNTINIFFKLYNFVKKISFEIGCFKLLLSRKPWENSHTSWFCNMLDYNFLWFYECYWNWRFRGHFKSKSLYALKPIVLKFKYSEKYIIKSIFWVISFESEK